jgi:hypothetical protein
MQSVSVRHLERRLTMEYFAGLDVSMEETHVCVMNREGVIAHEEKTVTTPEANRSFIRKSAGVPPSCFRDGPDGADALSWAGRSECACGLH